MTRHLPAQAGYQVHDSSAWSRSDPGCAFHQSSVHWSCLCLEHKLLSVKSYLNTEAKFWENKQGKAISFMTPLLFTASITITIAKAAVSVQIRIATKFLTAVTKKSTVFSLELFNPVIWSFCCFTANCHLLKGTEKIEKEF